MPIDPKQVQWDAAPAIDVAKVKWDEPKGQSAAYKEGRTNKPGALQGLVSVINGPLMGFADEVLGGIGGAIDTVKGGNFTDNYRANRDTVRGMIDSQRETNPWTTGITQAAASAPLSLVRLGAAPVQAVRGVLNNSMRAGATGVGYGAVGGVGNSTADTALGVAADGGIGGVLGGVTGAVGTPIIAGMGAVGSNVMARLSETQAAARAREKVAQALGRDARGTVFTSGQANPVTQVLARQNKLGPEATIVDAAGRNTNQLLDTLVTLPGHAKESVAQLQRQRTAGVGPRLRGAADDALGTGGARLSPTLEALDQSRRTAAAPLYDRLRTMTVTADDDLTQIVQAANQLGALGEARTMATALREPFTLDPAQAGNWGMRDLDHVKRGLDSLIERSLGPTGRATPVGRALTQLREQLVTKLDDLTVDPQTGASVYRAARDAYAGPSALMDAARAGRQAITQDEAAILTAVRGMTGGERDAFRIGAFEGLRAKLGTQGGQTNIINMWKEPATREKLQVIFGDERSFREFAAAAAREGKMKGLQSVGTGSQTAARQAGMGDLDVSALGEAGAAIANAKSGNVLGMLGSARNAWNRVGTPEPVRNEMARILLSRGPEATQNLNSLRELIQQINERNAFSSDGIGLIGSQIGNRLATPLPYQ